MIDFIGLGAQKAGTSWLYACLYEHPQVCAPIKEIHYFSRPRFEKGQAWYESHFAACEKGLLKGEFSTSYLESAEAAQRIAQTNSKAKLIAVLRNPIDRVFSEYKNAIKAGEIKKSVSFEDFLLARPEAIKRGNYHRQLYTYFEYFSRTHLHVAIYEDSKSDPLAFVQAVYTFLEIKADFVPSMLKKYVNVSRTPRFVLLDKVMHKVAEFLRKIHLDTLVWWVKKSGVTDTVRKINTQRHAVHMSPETRADLVEYYRDEVAKLSTLLRRDLNTLWDI